MAKHSINLGYCIQLHNNSILSTKPRYIDCIIREVNKLYSNSMLLPIQVLEISQKLLEGFFKQVLHWAMKAQAQCSYQGTDSALSVHPLTMSLSLLLQLPSNVLAFLIPHCMPTTNVYNLPPSLLGSLPKPCSHICTISSFQDTA
jgi:hypothetical protein